jgi:hypothetical protein
VAQEYITPALGRRRQVDLGSKPDWVKKKKKVNKTLLQRISRMW